MSEKSEIIEFYKNQTIFITGGTGLVGKVLIEKLLRTCDVKKIYVLMRPKKNKTIEERFDEFTKSSCFELIKTRNIEKKIALMNGDCHQANLGLSEEDIQVLIKETTCVIHAAANIRFDLPIRDVAKHIQATRDLLQLATKLQQLKVFLFVSTAYSNCIHNHIGEEFYKPPMKADTLFDLIDSLTEEQLEKITPTLLENWPNSYCYAKCITEDILKSASTRLPIAVVRPSIICNTYNEPIRGWIEKPSALIGVMCWGLQGIAQTFYIKNKCLHIVPADFVCNCILAACWKRANDKSNTCPIYNNVGQEIAKEHLNKILKRNHADFASVKSMWKPTVTIKSVKWKYLIQAYFYSLPFLFLDFLALLKRDPIRAFKIYKTINKITYLLTLVAVREWIFDTQNMQNLWNSMGESDRKTFPFFERIENLDNYFHYCYLGIRLYLLRDPIETLKAAKQRNRILAVAHYVFLSIIALFLCFLLKLSIKL